MEVKPFRAYRFNKNIVGDVGDCIAPPYDVISDDMQSALYARSDYNIVRIIKPRAEQNTDSTANIYTRAAELIKEWIASGTLIQDDSPAIYAYVQDFELAGAWFQRYAFVALGKLEPFGKTVKAHENTLVGPRKDRLNLKRATAADFGLVYMLYADPKHVADAIVESRVGGEALGDLTDDLGVRHRMFAVTDEQEITAIEEMMQHKSCIIADGHHRYETGLAYAAESGNPNAQYQMLAFSNTCHKGLIVLATHRLVDGVENFNFAELMKKLETDFVINKLSFNSSQEAKTARHAMLDCMKAEHAHDGNCFGIYGGDGAFYVATLKNKEKMDEIAPDKSRAWRHLDVTILSQLVLDRMLGVDAEKLASGNYVTYIKDSGNKAKELVASIDAGRGQVVFFLNPPKIEQIQQVAAAGERMPQKSTYFYPKIFTGFTINKL